MKLKWSICGLSACLVIALMLPACGRNSPPLPKVTVSEVPAPKTTSIVLKSGMLLRDVAKEVYGHERFYRFIMVVNGLTDESKIPAGKNLQTPSLAAAFQDVGLDPHYQPAINALAKATMEFESLMPAYMTVRQASGVSSGTFTIPRNIGSAFFAQADAMEAAKNVLCKAKPPHEIPTITIQHLEQSVTLLRILAKGEIDGYGYDYDMVSQHTALSLSCAFVWMKDGYR